MALPYVIACKYPKNASLALCRWMRLIGRRSPFCIRKPCPSREDTHRRLTA